MQIPIIVDVEADGPIIGKHSMVCFGAVVLTRDLKKTFYGQTKPISDSYVPEALKVSGFTRAEHLAFPTPQETMLKFLEWLKEVCGKNQPVLYSDNNGFDASWINYYMLDQVGQNPFGWSSRRIGDLFCGFYNDPQYRWKKHRKTTHTHNPVDDAKGNAEALLYLIDQGFKLWK
jgi:hypothetical protein